MGPVGIRDFARGRKGPTSHAMTVKSGFFEMAKRAKLAYFDGNLLNRKMVVAKTLLKSGFLLILMLLKSGFHCSIIQVLNLG